MKRTPEQEAARRERSWRESQMPRCRCNNVATLGSNPPTCRSCREAGEQANDDSAFLYELSDTLGISKSDLERLIEIARRGAPHE